MAKRDTYLYHLYLGREKVYTGTTNNPDRRMREHLATGKEFSRMEIERYPRTLESARRLEAERLANYRRRRGRNPRYNATDHG